jgi:8-oxo-dGTP pyrophosphatase MutT (NUDIX family)
LVGLHLQQYLISTGQLDSQEFNLLKRQIDEGHDLRNRKTYPGHATSSFMLLSPDKTKILMIHHKGLNKWLCPGGHYEGDVPLRISALRELTEETGFPEDKVDWLRHEDFVALDVDTHLIPARPTRFEVEHYHHDFLYLGIAMEEVELKAQEEEVFAVEWKSLDEAALLPDERMKRVVAKVKKILDETSDVS